MNYEFDWSELAFGSKKPLNDLKATFIAAPRELSTARLTQLIKQYLPQGNIVLGLAKELYIEGFDGQPQFKTLQMINVKKLLTKVNAAPLVNKVYSLSYYQRDAKYILEKIKFKKVLLVNGSWHYDFHTTEPYFILNRRGIPYELISPFTDEAEAKVYAIKTKLVPFNPPKEPLDEAAMLTLATQASKQSFDYGFQTGAVLGKKDAKTGKYKLVNAAINKIVPYETYAMHFGAEREKNFSRQHDLNFYNTVHAEVGLLLNAVQLGLDISGTTLFINLMPCPTCARMLAASPINELVYQIDHSEGYAVKLLEKAGKTVRRVVV